MTTPSGGDLGRTHAPLLFQSARYSLHFFLFLLTFFTTTISGVQWLLRDPFELNNFSLGLPYSIAILFILGSHEFGHYFAARYHRVEATLPYFIPFPPIPILFQLFINFGTFGAVIRTRSQVPDKKAMFDIGVAGPIAGFIACIIVLSYGFLTLPGPEYIRSIHPDFDFQLNAVPNSTGLPLEFGPNLLYLFLQKLLTNPATQWVPPMSEMYHYPFLCVGWFGLFVTAMNLIPIGQFDGGHVVYCMFGDLHRTIARWAFYALILLALPSVSDIVLRSMLGFVRHHEVGQIVPFAQYSWSAWLLWAVIAYSVVRLYHPPVPDETPLDDTRMKVGWLTVGIFVLCFTAVPFSISF